MCTIHVETTFYYFFTHSCFSFVQGKRIHISKENSCQAVVILPMFIVAIRRDTPQEEISFFIYYIPSLQ